MIKTYGVEDASFQAAGGESGVKQLVSDFYKIMDTNPTFTTIRQMHKTDLSDSRNKLVIFLCGWLGGPKRYKAIYGPINIPQVHKHLKVSHKEKEDWLNCMRLAIKQQNYPNDFAEYLLTQLRVPAEKIVEVSQNK